MNSLDASNNVNQESSTTESQGKTYIIKKGDTLGNIAKEFKTSVDKLAADNRINNADKIKVGDKITIN